MGKKKVVEHTIPALFNVKEQLFTFPAANRRILYDAMLRDVEQNIYENTDIIRSFIKVQLADGSTIDMDIAAFYINLVMWLPNITFNEPVTDEHIYDFSELDNGTYGREMDRLIEYFVDRGHDFDTVNVIGKIKGDISKMTKFYGSILGNTFSLWDLMALESRSPEFAELFNTTLDTAKMTPSEMQDFIKAAQSRVKDIIADDKRSALYPFIVSGIIGLDNIGQMLVAVGPRSDIHKSILPEVITKNWIHGLLNMAQLFVEATTSRNANIIKSDAVPISGNLSRESNIACMDIEANVDYYDCGTKHYLHTLIDDEVVLKFYCGQYQVLNPKEGGNLVRPITMDDTDLIGTYIEIRGIPKCITANKVNTPCSICIGTAHRMLKSSRIGGYVSITYINRLSQIGLSAKHLTKTKSEDITDMLITSNFSIMQSSLYYTGGKSRKISKILYIPTTVVEDMVQSDINPEDSEGYDFSVELVTLLIATNGKLETLDMSKKPYFLFTAGEVYKKVTGKGCNVVPGTDPIFEGLEGTDDESVDTSINYVAIDLASIDENEPLFTAKILTEEVSKYLDETLAIINGSKTQTYTSHEQMIRDSMLNVIGIPGVNKPGIVRQIMVLSLVLSRDPNDELAKPDYTKVREPEVKFLKITNSIRRKDLFGGILYSYIKVQLAEPITLRKKIPGLFDTFFANEAYRKNTKKFKKTRKYLWNKKK